MFGSPKRSALLSGLLHAVAIALVLALTGVTTPLTKPLDRTLVWIPHLADYKPHGPAAHDGGGGGGKHDLTPASPGDIRKASLRPFVPPTVRIVNEEPRLAMESAILASPDAPLPTLNLGVWGDPHAPPGPPSDGPGKCCGIGGTGGNGVGNHKGDGYGPDDNVSGISGDGHMGGVFTPPEVLWKNEPEYTEDARRAKIQGTVLLSIEIDARGQVQNIRVRQSLGLGLDERASEAVRAWKFRPARRNGKAIAATAYVEVNFRLL